MTINDTQEVVQQEPDSMRGKIRLLEVGGDASFPIEKLTSVRSTIQDLKRESRQKKNWETDTTTDPDYIIVIRTL